MIDNLATGRAPAVNTYGFLWSGRADHAVSAFMAQGYREFELMVQPPHLSLDLGAPEVRALAALMKSGDITVHTLNMPTLDTNLASPVPEMRAYSIEMFRRQIRLAGAMGVGHIVCGPGRISPLCPAPAELLDAWMTEAVAALLPLAREEGVRLALENLPIASFPKAGDLLAFLDRVGSRELGVCYDAANAHFIGEDPVEGLRLLADRLSIVHFSDTRRDAWRHDPVGEGEIGFERINDALDEIEYRGPLVLEIVCQDRDPVAVVQQSHARLIGARHAFSFVQA